MGVNGKLEVFVSNETIDAETIVKNRRDIIGICEPFRLNNYDDDVLRNVKDTLLKEIKNGLCRQSHLKAEVKCHPTFVRQLPTGCERGNYLTLKVNNTNCYVTLIQLHNEIEFKPVTRTYEIPQTIKVGPGRDLFDFLSLCLSNFIHKYLLYKDVNHLAVIFCFPVRQKGLSQAVLLKWTKGISCVAVVGRDMVALLREAINRRKDIQIGVIIVLNNTIGTLVSCASRNMYTKIGIVVDEGCNACYVEKAKYVDTVASKINSPPTILINTEWGGLGDNGSLNSIRTKFDKIVDRNSTNKGQQIFEKMTSASYISEIVNSVIEECVKMGILFQISKEKPNLNKYALSIKEILNIVKSESDDQTVIQKYLKCSECPPPNEHDCRNVRYICETIVHRSAYLVGVCIACLIDRIGDPYTAVGIDGCLYRDYPGYRNILESTIYKFTLPEHKFYVILSDDGAARGAALITAMEASKYKKI